jgi:hypothetical protein
MALELKRNDIVSVNNKLYKFADFGTIETSPFYTDNVSFMYPGAPAWAKDQAMIQLIPTLEDSVGQSKTGPVPKADSDKYVSIDDCRARLGPNKFLITRFYIAESYTKRELLNYVMGQISKDKVVLVGIRE